MSHIPTDREPTHSSEMLLEEFLKPMGLTQPAVAEAINISPRVVSEIINHKRAHHAEHRLAVRKILWHVGRLLAQTATALGRASHVSRAEVGTA